MTSQDLAAQRRHLETEVAGLQRQLTRSQMLLQSLRASGPEPQGFVWGMIAGLGVVAAGFAWFVHLARIGLPG